MSEDKKTTSEAGPYYCDTFKGGVFGPNGLEVKTDNLLGNEVELLTKGFAQGRSSVLAELKEFLTRMSESQPKDSVSQFTLDLVAEKLHKLRSRPVALADAKKPEYPNFWVEETGKDEWKVKMFVSSGEIVGYFLILWNTPKK